MLPGETVASGAPTKCGDEGCPGANGPQICQSGAGFYIGFMCDMCGPYSRESGYFRTREDAEAALDAGGYERDASFNPGSLRAYSLARGEDQ